MNGGFMFDGVDIEDIGLEYAPDNKNTQVYKPSEWTIHEQSFSGHDGGYFFGATLQPKTFTLRCIYDNIHISNGLMSEIHSVFRRGNTGKLVFKNRPWLYYMATVIDVDTDNMLNYRNGIVTITLRAHYPFARCEDMYITEGDEWMDDKLNNSALMIGSRWESDGVLADSEHHMTANSNRTFYIANPGTERAAASIQIAGDVGSGVTIVNMTTGQMCSIVGLNDGITTDVSKHLVIDSLSGQTTMVGQNEKKPAFLYHGGGFIDLEPAFPVTRDVLFTMTQGNGIIDCSVPVSRRMIGKRVYLDDGTFEANIIDVVGSNRLATDRNAPSTGTKTGSIMLANEIYVHCEDDMDLSLLIVRFKPTFA